MFYLVRFPDGSEGTYHQKNVRSITGNSCIVKHKGCTFEASILNIQDSNNECQKMLKPKNASKKDIRRVPKDCKPLQTSKITTKAKYPKTEKQKQQTLCRPLSECKVNQSRAIDPHHKNGEILITNSEVAIPPNDMENIVSNCSGSSIISGNLMVDIDPTDKINCNKTYAISIFNSPSEVTDNNESVPLILCAGGVLKNSTPHTVTDENEVPVPFEIISGDVIQLQNGSISIPLWDGPEMLSIDSSESHLHQTFENIIPFDGVSSVADKQIIYDFVNEESYADLVQDIEIPEDSLDPDYEPLENITSKSESTGLSQVSTIDSCTISLVNDSCKTSPGPSTLNCTGLTPCMVDSMYVNQSRGRNGDKKFNFCIFCHTKQIKIARHLELKHKAEEEVQKFLVLPKGNLERRKIIEVIRKKGNYLFNSDGTYNDGELIVTRRPNPKFHNDATGYLPCARCKAYFAKNTLRAHYKKCNKISSKNHRTVMVMSKRVIGRIHKKASSVVREHLFPPLREDHISKIIRYDEIIITYSNRMVEKYKEGRHFEMIRQRLRLIGRFLTTMRRINDEVTDLKSVYDPKFIDDTTKAINCEARLDDTTYTYGAPTVAFNLGTLLKQIGNIVVSECIKQHDERKKKDTENYLQLLTHEVTVGVNKTVAESQFQQQRRNKVELPSNTDVKRLHAHLSMQRHSAFANISNKYTYDQWLQLAESTLTSVQLFNRRRAGEIERALIDDFNSYQSIQSADANLYSGLCAESQELADKYIRFVIRGKLNRNVPVLLDNDLFQCINIILQFRSAAGVSSSNPYIFGVSSEDNTVHKYLRACNLLRKFSSECGAENPSRLRGTKLRKHIATTCINLNLSDNEVSDLANFMGHGEKIHKTFYRQPVIARDITRMSRLLEIAQGASIDSEDSSEDDLPGHSTLQDTDVSRSQKPSTSISGTVRRIRWTEREKSTVVNAYKSYMKQEKLPSLSEIQILIDENIHLKKRSAAQVKTWISNQYKNKQNFD